MKLDIIRDEAGFRALEPCWDALLEQSAVRTPFLRWDWVSLWWEEFHEGFTLAIAVVRDDHGTPLAIAPLMIGREVEGVRRHLQHLGFLGGLGEVKGERLDFLVPAGREPELTPILCQVFHLLGVEWQAVRLNKLPEESPNYPWIVQALHLCTTGGGILKATQCECIRLSSSWTEFEAALPGKHRRELRRRRELLKQENDFQEQLVTSADMEVRLDEFADLHRQHYPDGVSSFVTPKSWRFHRRLAQKWLPSGRAMLPFLAVGGDMVGGIYGFVEGDEFLFFQLGWHSRLARFSMGHLSIRWAVECCMVRSLRLFDMLPGTYRYKKEWSQTSRQVLDLEAYQPESLRAALFRSIRHLKRLLPGSSPSSISA